MTEASREGPSPEEVRRIIRANNRVWYLLYYDELIERPEGQLTLLRGADQRYYNAAQAVSCTDPRFLDEIEAFYEGAGLAPAVYLDPAVPEGLEAALFARGYVELLEDAELWHGFDVARLPRDLELGRVLKLPEATLRRVLLEERRGPLFDAFVELDARENDLSPHVAERLRENLATRRPGDVRLECLLYLVGETPVATGAVGIVGDLALLAEAATAATHRRLGLHSAMLVERLALARDAGCRSAYFTSTLAAASVRSGQRVGFRPAFARRYLQRRG